MSPKSPNSIKAQQTEESPLPKNQGTDAQKDLHIDIDHNNVIKLLMRVRNLYQAVSEIMHILELILQQREMFTN